MCTRSCTFRQEAKSCHDRSSLFKIYFVTLFPILLGLHVCHNQIKIFLEFFFCHLLCNIFILVFAIYKGLILLFCLCCLLGNTFLDLFKIFNISNNSRILKICHTWGRQWSHILCWLFPKIFFQIWFNRPLASTKRDFFIRTSGLHGKFFISHIYSLLLLCQLQLAE